MKTLERLQDLEILPKFKFISSLMSKLDHWRLSYMKLSFAFKRIWITPSPHWQFFSIWGAFNIMKLESIHNSLYASLIALFTCRNSNTNTSHTLDVQWSYSLRSKDHFLDRIERDAKYSPIGSTNHHWDYEKRVDGTFQVLVMRWSRTYLQVRIF